MKPYCSSFDSATQERCICSICRKVYIHQPTRAFSLFVLCPYFLPSPIHFIYLPVAVCSVKNLLACKSLLRALTTGTHCHRGYSVERSISVIFYISSPCYFPSHTSLRATLLLKAYFSRLYFFPLTNTPSVPFPFISLPASLPAMLTYTRG